MSLTSLVRCHAPVIMVTVLSTLAIQKIISAVINRTSTPIVPAAPRKEDSQGEVQDVLRVEDDTTETTALLADHTLEAQEQRLRQQQQHYIDISYDVEVSGTKTSKHFMVSCGLTVYDAITKTKLDEVWIQFARPQDRGWSDSTRTWWESKESLIAELARVDRGDGCSTEEGVHLMIDWIDNMVTRHGDGDPESVTFVSDTSVMDGRWMSYYLELVDHEPIETYFRTPSYRYYKDPICTSSYGLGLVAVSTEHVSRVRRNHPSHYFSEDQYVRVTLGIPDSVQPTTTNNHNPVDDCVHIIEEFYIEQQAAVISRGAHSSV